MSIYSRLEDTVSRMYQSTKKFLNEKPHYDRSKIPAKAFIFDTQAFLHGDGYGTPDANMMQEMHNQNCDQNMMQSHDVGYGGIDPNPCSSGFGGNEPPSHNIGMASPSFEPSNPNSNPLMQQEREYGLITGRDRYVKGTSLDLPESEVQLHGHGLGDSISHCHLKTYDGVRIGEKDTGGRLLTGYDYCKAEIDHSSLFGSSPTLRSESVQNLTNRLLGRGGFDD